MADAQDDPNLADSSEQARETVVRGLNPKKRRLLAGFAPTGKRGRNVRTGLASWEYEHVSGNGYRVWLRADGVVAPD